MLGNGTPPLDPVSAAWNTVARFDAYPSAQRDFSSQRQLVAARYDLIARGGTVDRARSMLEAAGLLPRTEAAS